MNEPNRKRHRWYLFYRFYTAIVWLSFAIWVIFWWKTAAENENPSTAQIITFVILVPLFAIAVFMLYKSRAFPFKYSCFGPLERTPLPREQPLFEQSGIGGRVRTFWGVSSFSNWYVYDSGLGVSMLGIGQFFIPYRDVETLNKSWYFVFTGSPYQLVHDSTEVKSPIYLPNKKLFEALRTAFEAWHPG